MIKLIDILKEEINLDDISNAPFSKLPPELNLISKRGSARNVYDYNDKYVLKIAKNSKGIYQNKKEIETLSKINSPLLPELKKYDKKNYKYIVIEKINDFKDASQFFKFIFPDIDTLYKKILDFYYQQKNGFSNTADIWDIPDNSKKDVYEYIIEDTWLQGKDLQFKNKQTDEIMFNITYDELNNMLKDNQNAKDLKELYDMGLGIKDFHWRNFGYKDSQLKMLDLGI
jgi:hypothetical protein